MKLTDKTNKKLFWREAGNKFFIEVDGRPVELKFTLAQKEAYDSLIAEKRENDDLKPKDDDEELVALLLGRIQKSIDHATRVVEIAMNPKSEKQFTRDSVFELFNEQLDLLQIVAHTWVDKKVFNPSLDKVLDPHTAP